MRERINQPGNKSLKPFKDQGEDCIPFKFKDYFELVDWGGREIKRNKRGYIPASVPPILARLRMESIGKTNAILPASRIY